MAEAGHVRLDGSDGCSAERVAPMHQRKRLFKFEMCGFIGYAKKMRGKVTVGIKVPTTYLMFVYCPNAARLGVHAIPRRCLTYIKVEKDIPINP
jgi:hypothetical protein